MPLCLRHAARRCCIIVVRAECTTNLSSLLHGVHLNVSWKHNTEAAPDEREDYYVAAVGYSRRITPDTMLVTDVVCEEEKEAGKTANPVALGIRHQVTPLTVVAAGAGTGLGDESPDFRVSLAFQHSF